MSTLTQTFNATAAGTKLQHAAAMGNLEIVELLLRNGADLNKVPSGSYLDNQADGFKADEPEAEAVSPDSQADGYKEPDVGTGQKVITMKPLTLRPKGSKR